MKLRTTIQRMFLSLLLFSSLWLTMPVTAGVAKSLNKSQGEVDKNPIHLTHQTEISQLIQVQQSNVYSYTVFLPTVYNNLERFYYISPNGFDPAYCGGGTYTKPWKTWTKAEKCISAGSTVYFMAGNYTNIFSESGRRIITFNGVAGRSIKIKPAPGAEGQVYFNQPLTIQGKYGVLSGIDINANSTATAIAVYKAQNILIKGNKIHDSTIEDCVHIHRGSGFISVVNNEIYNCGYGVPGNKQGDAIDTTGGTNLIYRGNHIHNTRQGFQIKGGATNVLVENNRLHDLGAAIFGYGMGSLSGPDPRHGNLQMHDPAVPIEDRYQAKNVTIRNNLVYNTHSTLTFIFGGWSDYKVYNNTFFNLSGSHVFYMNQAPWEFFDSTALAYCASHTCVPCTSYSGPLPCIKVPLPTRNGRLKNNIVYGFDKILLAEPGNSTNLELANNLYYSRNFTKYTTNAYRIENVSYNFTQIRARGYEVGSLIANPKFIDITNLANPNLKLSGISPAIDRGYMLSDIQRDFENIARPQGQAYDIGAYEFLGSQSVTNADTLLEFESSYSIFLPFVRVD